MGKKTDRRSKRLFREPSGHDDLLGNPYEQEIAKQPGFVAPAAPVCWHSRSGLMKDFIDRTLSAYSDNDCLAGQGASLRSSS